MDILPSATIIEIGDVGIGLDWIEGVFRFAVQHNF
jgi:hypothetical protein